MLDRLLFPARIDTQGAVVPKGWRTKMYQRVHERGRCLPWCWSEEKCQAFWQVPAGKTEGVNRPEDYAEGPVSIMRYVLDFISAYVKPGDSILEVGCNAGSKMNQLFRAGYSKLAGLDVNPASLEVLPRYFPDLARVAELHASPAEAVLPKMPSDSRRLIYSVSTLCLVHPTQHGVFDEIARVSSGYVLTLEIEWAAGKYFFPRNYRRVFEPLGFAQVASTLISRDLCPEPELPSYYGHVMRLMRKK